MSEQRTDTGARPWHGSDSPFEAFYQWLVGEGVVKHFVPADPPPAAEPEAGVVSQAAEPAGEAVEADVPAPGPDASAPAPGPAVGGLTGADGEAMAAAQVEPPAQVG